MIVYPTIVVIICLHALAAVGQPLRRPFPQHIIYSDNIHIPNHIGREQLDDSVRSFYTAWKEHYLRKGCHPGEYYIWFEERGAKQCVSEGQGYGMMIVSLMAGWDTAARTIYDGLYRYYRAHPSGSDSLLMAWAQRSGCRDLDSTSATDGDMDIAYSLLLADAQWSSGGRSSGASDYGAIDYAGAGRRMIADILIREINQKDYTILLSNGSQPDSKDYNDMRSSDFMPAHFRVFARVSGDTRWTKAIENNYRLFRYMQEKYSPEAGLLPDFITGISVGEGSLRATPARPHYLESRYDGDYYYNACRVPWRIGEDLILNGDPRAALLLEKINRWIRSTTRDNPDNISAGYGLDGNDLPHHYFEALSFITPFAVAAMAGRDPGSQAWLNKLWDYIVHFRLRQFDYYDNSIKMIGLIILSGNYWAP
jgi:endo-1,4-beta-D-glucanase Y